MTLFDLKALEPDDTPMSTPPGPMGTSAVEPFPQDGQTGVDLSSDTREDAVDMVEVVESPPAPDVPGDGEALPGERHHPEGGGREQSRDAEVLLHLSVPLEELFASSDLGDLLRLVNLRPDDIRLVVKDGGTWEMLLRNPTSGMWRLQSRPDFPALLDLALSEVNAEAVSMAGDDALVSTRVLGRLLRHTDGGVSVTKVMRRAARLADDSSVPIARVDTSSLNPVSGFPILRCRDHLVRLSDGIIVDPADVTPHFLLDMTPCPTAYAQDAMEGESPGAEMMRRFLRLLGNGDDRVLAGRLGWHLCGHHQTIDVIAGDYPTLILLAQALRDTLGPSGARILSMGRGAVRPQHIADAMEQARLCLWTGADTAPGIPVWDLNALVSHRDPRHQGNIVMLVADWPEDWETLDHRIAGKCGWAWRMNGTLSGQGIDPDVLLDTNGRECLLTMLVEGAGRGFKAFQTSKENGHGGDPGQVAATDDSRAYAEEMRLSGANAQHRTLHRVIRFTDDPRDAMTLSEIEDVIATIGEDPIPHHVLGKMIRRMWPAVESVRDQIDGVQTRIIRRIAPSS